MTERGLRSSGPVEAVGMAARSRVRLSYLWRMGRFPDLAHPRRFTEWVQWRKLFDRSPHHPTLMDKIAAKRKVESALCRDWIIPTPWSGFPLPSAPPVSGRAMLKARHGCNQNRVLDHPEPMLATADVLAADEDFLRVDFNEIHGHPLFGEFCLYPGSGLDRFGAPGLDRELGKLWSAAHRARQDSSHPVSKANHAAAVR